MEAGLNRKAIREPSTCEPVAVTPQVQADFTGRTATLNIALLTGGQDRHYAVGLATALMKQNVALDVIGSTEIDGPEFQGNRLARFRNLHGAQQSANTARKIGRILLFYARLIGYAATANPKIFHILWNNKLQICDRTLLMFMYKLLGKKIVLTAHNINAGRRDENDSWLNQITLKCQYKLADHVFVHTSKMKDEMIADFGTQEKRISVIPYGINNAVPATKLTSEEARRRLGLRADEKVILYFGAIKQYKGLEYLVAAFQQIAVLEDFRLIIAGERKKGHEEYWHAILRAIGRHPSRERILQKIEFIPDSETEIYFKASDVAVLPYTEIFQSGILFLAYAFGLPVIASDVGSLAQDIVEGRTGFVCRPRDSEDLARVIGMYFRTDLYRELEDRRQEIREITISRHSWDVVASLTRNVYLTLLEN